MGLATVLLIISCFAASAHGHGYLMEPPGRASAWRYGFDTPVDYDDMQCFCGGFNYQYQEMGGKCGICGDAWDADPRPHEVGGIYATGTLVRNYRQGQIISVTANVTANHLGHFEYKICANNDVTVEATQECLDLTPLYGVGHDEWFLYIDGSTGAISHDLQLPADLECEQCVLQWRYVTSNTWGTCDNGTESVGCGPQEEFRGCADVSILAPPQERKEPLGPRAEQAEEIYTESKEEEIMVDNIMTANEEGTSGKNVYPARTVDETREQNVNTTGEEATKEERVNTTGEEEATKEERVNTSGEEATKEERVNTTGEEEATKEERVNTTGEEEATKEERVNTTGEEEATKEESVNTTGEKLATNSENIDTASEEEETKEENGNTTDEEEETEEEETAQLFNERASKLKEMPSSAGEEVDEQEEVTTSKKKSKRDKKKNKWDKKSEDRSDDDDSDEDEATVESEED